MDAWKDRQTQTDRNGDRWVDKELKSSQNSDSEWQEEGPEAMWGGEF